MSGSVNRVILLGNLVRDPEVRHTQGNQKVVNITVATSERWKDKATGESQERSEFSRVVIFNERLADVAERYLRKGSQVYVEGQLQTRKWTDQSGQERWTTEVVLSRFRGELTLLGGRADGDETPARTSRRPASVEDDLDDSIPFSWAGVLIAPTLALLTLGGLA